LGCLQHDKLDVHLQKEQPKRETFGMKMWIRKKKTLYIICHAGTVPTLSRDFSGMLAARKIRPAFWNKAT